MFCDIDNIHAVRDAYSKIIAIGQNGALKNPQRYLQEIDKSNYMHLASNILAAVNNILERILTQRQNVLVHCTDGWDRTAQLSGLAQLMLDGRYRTIRGFQQLIEKEWLSFGHQFARRYGHHNSNYGDE